MILKFYIIFNAEHAWLLKKMALSWSWFLLLPKLTIWFLDEHGWIHREKWLWLIRLQGTKLFSIFNLAVGLGMWPLIRLSFSHFISSILMFCHFKLLKSEINYINWLSQFCCFHFAMNIMFWKNLMVVVPVWLNDWLLLPYEITN